MYLSLFFSCACVQCRVSTPGLAASRVVLQERQKVQVYFYVHIAGSWYLCLYLFFMHPAFERDGQRIGIYIAMCRGAHVYIYMYVCRCAGLYVCMCIRAHIRVGECVYIYVYRYIQTYIDACV